MTGRQNDTAPLDFVASFWRKNLLKNETVLATILNILLD
jgi:hypothetical protein